MKTFDCRCGTRLEADPDDDLLAVVREHAQEQHGEDPLYSDMELEGDIARSAHEQAE